MLSSGSLVVCKHGDMSLLTSLCSLHAAMLARLLNTSVEYCCRAFKMYRNERNFDKVSSNPAEHVAVTSQCLVAHRDVVNAGTGQLEGGATEA